ncbi:MAG: DUF5916 domain-containing protein, partial [Flavitalea sp.]
RSERAVLRNNITGKDSVITTEALTNYNVIVLDQALKNRSFITFTNTNVIRNGNARDANVAALDLQLYDKSNNYGVLIQPRYSKIFDTHGGYDGFKNYIKAGKVSGKFQFIFSNDIKTAKYDPNDLGFLLSPNEIVNTGKLSYNIYQPTKTFLNQQYNISLSQSYLYKPFEYERTEIIAKTNWTLKNFWTLQFETGGNPSWSNDFFELQTPSSMFSTPREKLRRSPYYYLFASGTTDNRKRLYLNWSIGGSEGPLPKDPFNKAFAELRYRFSDRFTLTSSYERQHDHGQFGYSFIRDPVSNEPILARRQNTVTTSIVSGIYNFTPRMNLTFRARHFWNRILNTNLYDVKPDGYWTPRLGTRDPATLNINYNVFNLDVFYTWDFRLGSRIIFAWKNSLGTDYEDDISGSNYRTYPKNVDRIFTTPHGNEFTIRFIYFLNAQQFRKRF